MPTAAQATVQRVRSHLGSWRSFSSGRERRWHGEFEPIWTVILSRTAPGPIEQPDLYAIYAFGMSRQLAMAALAKGLRELGYVRQRGSSADRTIRLLGPTTDGVSQHTGWHVIKTFMPIKGVRARRPSQPPR